MTVYLPTTSHHDSNDGASRLRLAKEAAVKLEATFLAEMLKSAGFGSQENSFSGSAGEDQFTSFQRQAVADKIAMSGGIGLAESFLKSIMEQQNDNA
ncbi:rod-binding protein [Roseovarius aestuariivivens]|uniref:rod-binding protein n=1 Tax=Roseovarius aestuariivivens TaxID=1888910 RepID=UPI001FD87DBE|nr:rod-binding protein [Roseovarius aestuariivivens]